MKWEYQRYSPTDEVFDSLLKREGKEGWETVYIQWNAILRYWVVIFKRRKTKRPT